MENNNLPVYVGTYVCYYVFSPLYIKTAFALRIIIQRLKEIIIIIITQGCPDGLLLVDKTFSKGVRR